MKTEIQREILLRLSCIEGHLRGIQNMVAENRSELEVLQQLRAVQGALSAVNNLISCEQLAAQLFDGGDDPEALRETLLDLFEQQAGWRRSSYAFPDVSFQSQNP